MQEDCLPWDEEPSNATNVPLVPSAVPADQPNLTRGEDTHFPKGTHFSWPAVSAVVTVVLLGLALSAYFIYEGSAESSMYLKVHEATKEPRRTTTPAAIPAGRRGAWVEQNEAPIRVLPNVLLCGTNGRGSPKLGSMLTRYCTHVIYTGAVNIVFNDTSAPSVTVADAEGFEPFATLSKSTRRYLSFPWGSAQWDVSEVLSALAMFLQQHHLRGIELRFTSAEQVEKCAALCPTFKDELHGSDGLLLRVGDSLELTQDMLETLSEIAKYLIVETQATRRDELRTRRYPNPYQPYNGSHVNDVYMRQRLWRIHPWKRRLGAEGVCFTVSLAVIRGTKGVVNGDPHRITSYLYTKLREPCVLQKLKALIDPKALSRSRESGSTFYGYDNRKTLTTKLRRIAHEFPQYCIAAYNVEMDDFEGVCPRNSTPLLRVLRKLVTPLVQIRLLR